MHDVQAGSAGVCARRGYAEYDAEVREMLHLLKFNGVRPVAGHLLGEYLAKAVLKLEDQAARELIVIPVPLFAARERSRGFNQSNLLAEAAVKHLRKLRRGWKLKIDTKSFARVKDTHALFTMQPHERRKSLRGAFRVTDAEAIREPRGAADRRHHDHRSDGERVRASVAARRRREGLGGDGREGAAGECKSSACRYVRRDP